MLIQSSILFYTIANQVPLENLEAGHHIQSLPLLLPL